MCRSIKQLRYPERSPTDEELEAAATQYIRKITGYRKPSKQNQEPFDQAIAEIVATTRQLFSTLMIKDKSW
jgi:hypothetical protein